jgi:hypothetical protein
MSRGEFLTRMTVWVSFVGYLIAGVMRTLSKNRTRWASPARTVSTIACIAMLIHVFLAFQFYHSWSHQAAYEETAKQTSAVAGFNWGGGVYFNYILLTGWVFDTVWWWRGQDAYSRRPSLLVASWDFFLAFMFFNAVIVFESGATRIVGLILFLVAGIVWLIIRGRWTRVSH